MTVWGRALLGATLASLGGCTSGPLEGGRYQCDPDAGDGQCPGDYRCGLERYCHALGDAKPWLCERNEHCENGWSCGLNQAGDAGECHLPSATIAHTCFDDSHCTAGWHCGPSNRCYDRSVPADHVCRFDAGDCAANWRCGLSGRCQNQDAGAAYLCRTDAGLQDFWCEQGWRCSPEGSCIDPGNDALVGRVLATQSPQKVHPLTPPPLERLSVSSVHDAGFGQGQQTVAYVQDGQLRARLYDGPATTLDYALGRWDAGVGLVAQGSRGEYTDESGLGFYIDSRSRVLMALADAGVDVFTLEDDGGFLRESVELYGPVTRMTLGSSANVLAPRILSFTDRPDFYSRLMGGSVDSYYQGVFREYGVVGRFDEVVPNNRLVDAVSVREKIDFECVFAVDQRGLWASQRGSDIGQGPVTFDFEAVELPQISNDRCRPPAADTLRITRMAPLDRNWLGVSLIGIDGGSPQVALIDLRPMWDRVEAPYCCTTQMGQACTAGDRIPVEYRMGPCPACSGGRILDFATVYGPNGDPTLEVRCGAADGGISSFFNFAPRTVGTECNRTNVLRESALFASPALITPDHPTPGQVAWGRADGLIWKGGTTARAASDLFDRIPAVVARRGPLAIDLRVFADELSGTFVPGVGLVAKTDGFALKAVTHRPEWVVTKDRVVLDLAGTSANNGEQIGVVGSPMSAFAAPYQATFVKSAAASVLIVSAGTSVFSAEMDATLAQQQLFATLTLKVVGPSQIDSLAFPQRAPPSVYLRGYAVTPNGVLLLTAQTANQWGFEPVVLPVSLLPREVWFENDRGRVGFADGTVYALPSRVPIAPPLPDGVVDYEQVCGQQLALGTSGLFRLETSPGSSIGQWAPLPGFAGGDFANGRLHAMGDSVYVFKATGEATRLGFDNCPSF